MANSTYANFLTECGFEVNKSDFIFLDEANQVQVTDEALTGMMKFITDKYNSIDFSEIEVLVTMVVLSMVRCLKPISEL